MADNDTWINFIYTLNSKVDLCSEVFTVQYSIKYNM